MRQQYYLFAGWSLLAMHSPDARRSAWRNSRLVSTSGERMRALCLCLRSGLLAEEPDRSSLGIGKPMSIRGLYGRGTSAALSK